MRDLGHEETEEVLKKIEKRISAEYRQAEREIAAKLDDYMKRFAEKDKLKLLGVANGQITEEEYKQWRLGQVMIGKRWSEMRDSLAQDFANTSQIARSIAFDHIPEVYAINHDYGTFQVEKGSLVDTSYTLYDRQAIEQLYKDEDTFIPAPGRKVKRAINEGKQIAWDKKQVQSVMMQGLLQGESIPNIATRLANSVGEGDRKAAIRNARTLTTGIENAGRVASYDRANAMGIKTKKQWLAALDMRTRHWHASLDGVAVDNDKPFKNDYGSIMYPGDPEADPANIYNCRCTLIADIEGFENDLSDMSLRRNEKLGDMSYDEWKKGHYDMESDRITKQDEIAETMKRVYGAEYAKYKNKRLINVDGVDDVTEEYILKSTPGYGEIIKPKDFMEKNHTEELNFASWLLESLGGEIVHNTDSQTKGIHLADYTWNKKLWELKTLTTDNESTIDKHIQKAYSQIAQNKGGAFFDMSLSPLSINDTAKIIKQKQLQRCPNDKYDVLIKKGDLFAVMRIK